MLSIRDLRVGKIFIYKDQPHRVVEAKHVFMGRGSSTLQAKIKNLITGNLLSQSFKQSDNFEEADIDRREIKYLYNNRGEFWFCEPDDPSKRFKLEESLIADQIKFLKPNSPVKAMAFDEQIVSLELPVKMEFEIKSAPPGVKTDAAQRSTKVVTLENGTEIKAPMFINTGDVIRINTETGEYVERVTKS
jgi:elongation factor P